MIDIHSGEIKDILPVNLMSPEVEAISFAVGQALRKLQEFAMSSSLCVETGKVPEHVLDLMALELNTQYYEQSLPRDIKESLIRQTIPWYMHAGTVPVLEEFLNTVLDGGTITEWFRYDGEPYHFKALVKVGEHEIPLGYSRKIRQQINTYKNLRSWLESLVFYYAAEYWVTIRYNNCLRLQSEFYPRYNMAHHCLEGTHYLGGGKALNGYAVDEALDFYPVKLLAGGSVRQDTVTSLTLKVCAAKACVEVMGSNLLSACAGAVQDVLSRAAMDIRTECDASGSVAAENTSKSQVACKILADGSRTRIKAVAQERVGDKTELIMRGGCIADTAASTILTCAADVLCHATEERSLKIAADMVVEAGGMAETVVAFGCRVFVGADCNLTAEKNLQFLVGSGFLDGANTLNADVFYYHL